MPETFMVLTGEETFKRGRELGLRLSRGDIVLFTGDLGAGKTTMVRGIISELGHDGPVRSPTFNLIQLYSTRIPVMHADLYRLQSAYGIGLEDYLEDSLCLIEWPDRLGNLVSSEKCWRVRISFREVGRVIQIEEPTPVRVQEC